WTGYDDNRTMTKVPEFSYAKDIWADFWKRCIPKRTIHLFKHQTELWGFQSTLQQESVRLRIVRLAASCTLKLVMRLVNIAQTMFTIQKKRSNKDYLNNGMTFSYTNNHKDQDNVKKEADPIESASFFVLVIHE